MIIFIFDITYDIKEAFMFISVTQFIITVMKRIGGITPRKIFKARFKARHLMRIYISRIRNREKKGLK